MDILNSFLVLRVSCFCFNQFRKFFLDSFRRLFLRIIITIGTLIVTVRKLNDGETRNL